MLPTLSSLPQGRCLGFAPLGWVLVILVRSFQEAMQLSLLLVSQRNAQAMDKGFNSHGNLFSFSMGPLATQMVLVSD